MRLDKYHVLLIVILCSCGLLSALMPQSVFTPSIHSMMHSSLLSQNPNYISQPELTRAEGLSHPFKSPEVFVDHLTTALGLADHDLNLLSYRHQSSAFEADISVIAGYEHNFTDDTDYRFWYKGWDFFARAGERLSMYSLWYNGAYYGDLDAAESDELIDGYFKRFNRRIQLDNMNGYIQYETDSYSLALGRGRFQIAPSISGSIILSDNVNDYGYFLAEGRAGAFSLSFLHGSLKADSTYSIYDNNILNNRNYPDKFIALHQLNYRPNPNWDFYVGESVVYGNRSIDLGYLLPNSFWRAVEHNLWDRDNVLIYAGLQHRCARNITLYAQLALDEFSYSKIFSNWWGNKYALQGGIDHRHKAGSITLELSAVRPYTYAHFQNHSMYSHDGQPLGYRHGSNVLNLSLQNHLQIMPCLEWNMQAGFSYRGSEGTSWQDNYHEIFEGVIDEAEVQWFAGEINREYSISNSLNIPLTRNHTLLAGHQGKYMDEWQHRVFAAWQFRL